MPRVRMVEMPTNLPANREIELSNAFSLINNELQKAVKRKDKKTAEYIKRRLRGQIVVLNTLFKEL